MTEVHQYWTNPKELLVVVVAAAVAAAMVEVAEEVVEILAEVDHPVWEDCFRLECRS